MSCALLIDLSFKLGYPCLEISLSLDRLRFESFKLCDCFVHLLFSSCDFLSCGFLSLFCSLLKLFKSLISFFLSFFDGLVPVSFGLLDGCKLLQSLFGKRLLCRSLCLLDFKSGLFLDFLALAQVVVFGALNGF